MSQISSADNIATQEAMESLWNQMLPYLNVSDKGKLTYVGEIRMFYDEVAPDGFLICDGTTYNKADYPELVNKLFSLTDTTPYEVSGDDTKFKVPDLRGEFLRGTGTNSHTNQGSGANVGVHQDGTEHFHSFGNKINAILITDESKTIDNINADTYEGKARRYVDTNSAVSSTDVTGVYTSRPTNTSVLYCIAYKDTMVDIDFLSYGSEKFAKSDMYDTTERPIGKWIDGKPLYQKVVDCGYLTGTNPKTVNSGIGNVDKMISLFGFMLDETSHLAYTIPFAHDESAQYNVWQLYDISSNTISLFYRGYERATNKAYLILKYTKTTDTADSFKYSTPTDYSTKEKIIGTWIDGKPVYQKTVSGLSIAVTTSTSWQSTITIEGLKDVIDAKFYWTHSSGGLTLISFKECAGSNETIQAWGFAEARTVNAITVQYTKTTD